MATRQGVRASVHERGQRVLVVDDDEHTRRILASALRFGHRNKVVMSEYEFPTMGHIWLAQRPRSWRDLARFLESQNLLRSSQVSSS